MTRGTYVVGNIRSLDHLVHLFEIFISGMEACEVVQHEALELFFAMRRIGVDEGSDAGGILRPLYWSVLMMGKTSGKVK